MVCVCVCVNVYVGCVCLHNIYFNERPDEFAGRQGERVM